MKTLAVAALFAAIAIAQSSETEKTAAPELKASMIVIGVGDLSRSLKFYKETLSLPEVAAPGDLPMLRAGDVTIVLNPGMSGTGGAFELVFPVDSVAKVRKQLADRGCQFASGSREVAKDKWAATFTDPDRHQLTLFGGK